MILESKLLLVRIYLIKKLLNLIGFEIVAGHWIYPKLNSESIVIDLGANKAEFSEQLYAKYKAKCYAVEPNEDLYNEISNSNIVKFNCAISKENGLLNFYINNNNEASSVIKDFETNWGNKRVDVVEGVTWDSFLDKLNVENNFINILKVDIEGAELDLIESFTLENISSVAQITVEFHDWLNVHLHERTVIAIKKIISLNFIAISNTPDHSWPVEMLFLNRKLISYNFFQKWLLSIYNRLTFLKY